MMASRRALTMNDLARLAGVSVSTVSRSLAGHSTINPATRDRVNTIARQHGYQPNLLARNLRLQRTDAVAVIAAMPGPVDSASLSLVGHLADALSTAGYDMLLRRVERQDEGWLDRIVVSGRVDGVIALGQPSAEAIERVAADYAPLVLWGEPPGGTVTSIGPDDVLGGALATRHLLEHGCRRLLFVGDRAVTRVARAEAGFRNACDAAGLGASARSVAADPSAIRAAIGAVDGIVAASDRVAIAAIGTLAAAGRRVPDDVLVVGHGDTPLAEHGVPSLTTIGIDLSRGAQLLVERLVARIAGTATASYSVPPRLIVRESA